MSRGNLLNTRTINYLELIGNGKGYRVPPYQHDYSWSEEQWEDLWNDVLELRGRPDDRHYMGALVVETSDREFLIIDGQQRMATLSILAHHLETRKPARGCSGVPAPYRCGDTVGDGTAVCTISFGNNNRDVLIEPHAPFPVNTLLNLTVDGVEDLAGNAVLAQTTQFTTGNGPDTTRPQVVRTVPSNGDAGVPVKTVIEVEFNEPIDPTSVDVNGFVVLDNTTGTNLAGARSLAKLAIVEFSDYQCPYCVRHHTQTFPKLKETYVDTGKVQYIYRDFPLDFHAEARAAASAANCAGRQNAYWGMHHALFTHQSRLGPGLFEELAKTLGLDVSTFSSCIQGDEQNREVSADLAYGQSLRVNGTPTFFVGCIEGDRLVGAKQITGAQSFQAFAPVIDSLLKSTAAGKSCGAGAQVAGNASDRVK